MEDLMLKINPMFLVGHLKQTVSGRCLVKLGCIQAKMSHLQKLGLYLISPHSPPPKLQACSRIERFDFSKADRLNLMNFLTALKKLRCFGGCALI